MKNSVKLFSLLLVLCCAIYMQSYEVRAEELKGSDEWKVEFSQNKKMNSNFSTGDFVDVLDYMQPGDSASFQVKVYNSHQTTTDWYMSNKILKSLEDGSKTAKAGGYHYALLYTDVQGKQTVLFNSDMIGGENYREDREGLHEATNALEDYFYLDTLAYGEGGLVELDVLLDGETQGNDYQDTLAQLQLNFAVELLEPSSYYKTKYRQEEKVNDHYEKVQDDDVYTEEDVTNIPDDVIPKTTIVKTGDDTRLLPLFLAAGILGLLFLLVSLWAIKLRKQLKEE